jgi:lipoprotein NlpI
MRTTLLLLILLPVMTFAQPKVEDDPHRPLLLNAEQKFAEDRLDECLKLLDTYLEKAPANPRAYLFRGAVHDRLKNGAKAIPDFTKALELDPQLAAGWQRRGIAHFMLAKPKEAVADFDKYLELRPDERPHHWQRGIALYYAGRYDDGVKQFELHRTVNADDVENAAWHFLCLARSKSPEAARAALIPIEGDTRIPMMKVHALYAGNATPADVLAVATAGNPNPAQLNRHLFYAHLYLGLYYEALNQPEKAKEHLTLAAEKHVVPDYMHGVAVVHLQLLKAGAK